MSFLLSEEILEKVKCFFCKQYLSFGPTKVYASGDTACGRCAPNPDDGAPSLFDKIASYAIFPCVNRYEGCNQLLQYGNIPEHEKKCKGMLVACSICNTPLTFSLLSFLDHYNQRHVEYVLKKPQFGVCSSKITTHTYFLYCDNANNCIFIIYVGNYSSRVDLDAFVSRRKPTQVKKVLENMGVQKFCHELNSSSDSEKFVINFPTVDQKPEIIPCKFSFEVLHVATSVLSHYSRPIAQSKQKNFPKILFDDDYVKKYGSENNYKLSSCATKLVNEKNKSEIQFKCNFCENNFWNCPWKMNRSLFSCGECIICSDCFSNGYTKCTRHNKAFKEGTDFKIIFTMFYCRNDCGKFFTIWQLLCHEIDCMGGQSVEEFVKQQFKVIEPNYKSFIRGNTVTNSDWPERSPFQTHNIYMVTYDGLKFVLSYKKDGSGCNFKVLHDYDKTKYYVLIRIFHHNNGIIRKEVNDFNISYNYSSGGRYRTDSFFVVLLREINNCSLFIPQHSTET